MDTTNRDEKDADTNLVNNEFKFKQPVYNPNIDYYREFYKLNL
jgi:hypothetical protein